MFNLFPLFHRWIFNVHWKWKSTINFVYVHPSRLNLRNYKIYWKSNSVIFSLQSLDATATFCLLKMKNVFKMNYASLFFLNKLHHIENCSLHKSKGCYIEKGKWLLNHFFLLLLLFSETASIIIRLYLSQFLASSRITSLGLSIV